MFNRELIERYAAEAFENGEDKPVVQRCEFSCSGVSLFDIQSVGGIALALQDNWNKHVGRLGKKAYPRLIIGNIYANRMEQGDVEKLVDMGFDVSKEYEGSHADRIYTFIMLPHEE